MLPGKRGRLIILIAGRVTDVIFGRRMIWRRGRGRKTNTEKGKGW